MITKKGVGRMSEKRYKYLYEIKQTNPKPGEAIYYRGSRISKVEPQQDFWINYFTSSKLIKKKIEENGINAFIRRLQYLT